MNGKSNDIHHKVLLEQRKKTSTKCGGESQQKTSTISSISSQKKVNSIEDVGEDRVLTVGHVFKVS